MMNGEINIRIILSQPPPGICFGLQSGSGAAYNVLQPQFSGETDLIFETRILIRQPKSSGIEVDFSGPAVQGKAGERFFYIDIGTYAGDKKSPWARRLKIPLTGISMAIVQSVNNVPTVCLETTVPGTGKDGGPNCATVKPFPGWQIKSVDL